MRFSKVLLPEVFKGTRSLNPRFDEMAKKAYAGVEFTDGGITHNGDGVPGDPASEDYICYTAAFALAKRHLVTKAPTYHLCRGFALALMGMRDREVVGDLLPETFTGYVSIPSGLIGNISGAYIHIGEADKHTPFKPENWGRRVVWIAYFEETAEGNVYIGRMNFFLINHTGMTVQEIVKSYDPSYSFDSSQRAELTKLLLNTVLYLGSQDPELLALKPSFGAPVKKQNAHTVSGHLNLCTIPVIAVNWDYQRLTEYDTATTHVDGFLAWRRCGPNHSQIKLSWIREHERNVRIRANNHQTP